MNKIFSLMTSTIKRITGHTAEEYFNSGNEKMLIKDDAGAIVDFTKAIKLNPEYIEVSKIIPEQ
jgi:hypothetical protein